MNIRGHRGRVDANQKAIVKALRDIGCSVAILSSLGHGVADLLVGRNGVNLLLEVKSDDKQKLTPAETKFAEAWRGQLERVETVEYAVLYVLQKTK